MPTRTMNANAISVPSAKRSAITPKWWFFALSAVIILLSTALQLGCLNGGAVIDDKRLLGDFEGRGCGSDPVDCFHNMMFGFYYRPVLSASIAFGQLLHGNRIYWFHAENLVLHTGAVAMAIWMFRLLFRRRITALIAGLLYAVHPIQVCFTTFFGGRTETMVAIFILFFAVGVRCAARRMAIRPRITGLAADVKIGAWIAISMLGLLGAAFSKEQVVPIVLLAPLLAMPMQKCAPLVRRRVDTSKPVSRRRSQNIAPPPYWTAIYLIPVAVFSYAAHSALHDIDFVDAKWPLALHVEMVGRTLWSYTKIYLFPTVNTLHLTTLGSWDRPQLLVTLLGYAAGITWISLLIRNRNNRPRRILILWASLGLFSCLNVIPVPTQFASAYRAGIPLFGFAGITANLLVPDYTKRARSEWIARIGSLRLAIGAALVMAVWCSLVTLEDVPNWHDEPALMKAEVMADPNFVCARAALGSFDDQKGDYADALVEFNGCLDELFGRGTPAEKFPDMVRSESMIRKLQSASTLRYYRPTQYIPQIIREHGKTLLLLQRPADALADLRASLVLDPNDGGARDALTACYHQLHQDAQAEAVHRMDDVLLGRKL